MNLWQSTSERTSASSALEADWMTEDLEFIERNKMFESTTATYSNFQSEFGSILDLSEENDKMEVTTALNLPWEFIQDNGAQVEKLTYKNTLSSATLTPLPSALLHVYLDYPSSLLEDKRQVRVIIRNITQLTENDVEAALSLDNMSAYQRGKEPM